MEDGSTVEKDYRIPEEVFDIFEEKIRNLNKRAKKLGMDEVTYHVQRTEDNHDEKTGLVRRVSYIRVRGSAPRLSGWSFLGVLDHRSEGLNVVKTVPGADIPIGYWDAGPNCDHCQISRQRNETFVVYSSETDEYKQIGRQCLKDYFHNADPHDVAAWAETFIAFDDDLERVSEWDAGGKQDNRIQLILYLCFAAASIAKFGWVSRKTAQDGTEQATASTALYAMIPYRKEDRVISREEAQEYKEVVNAALEWLKIQPSDNEYIHNLKVICLDLDNVPRTSLLTKDCGIAASLVFAYRRHEDKEREKKNRAISEYVGIPGKEGGRQTFDVQVVNVRAFPTTMGEGNSYLHIMLDQHGNKLTWFCSKESNVMEVGHYYRITGSIKEHKEYKGDKQTVLQRVKSSEITGWNTENNPPF